MIAQTISQAFDACTNKDSQWQLPDETDILLVDEDLDHKGLFKKQMSTQSFCKILSKNTILQKARYNLLYNYVNGNPLSVLPLFLTEEELIHDIYKKCNTNNKYLMKLIYTKSLDSYKIDNYPKALENWITKDEFDFCMNESIKNFKSNSTICKNSDGKEFYFNNTIENKLKILKKYLDETEFELHIGHAGCGKSSSISSYLNSINTKINVVEISLSNTICNMFKAKVNNNKIDFKTYSCTAANYNKIVDKDIIVLDEFSQWGYYELDLLIKLIENNKRAKFLIMGDIDQIPTFLSSGSLLYSMMKTYPDKVKEYNHQYRFDNVPEYRDLITNIQEGKWPTNSYFIGPFNDIILKNADCVITGTNNHVDLFNLKCFELKHNISITNDYFKKNIWDLCIKYNDIPLISKETTTIQFNRTNYKIYGNTRYRILNTSTNFIKLESLVDNSVIFVNKDNIKYFNICYAITVNKAQGLEWDNIVVYIDQDDFNLKNYNALYVAVSRGKNNVIMSTGDNKAVTITDLNKILKIQYKMCNDFKFLNLQ